MIAGRAVVHEPDDLIAELAVLEDLVRDEAAQLAGSGDQNPLQPDAGAPAALEHLAHELARRVGGRGVQDEEDAPDHLRHLEGAAGPEAGREVGLHVQRRDDAEDHREDAADEHGEEIVDARAAAAQPIEALKLEAERHQRGDERQHVEVVLERRHALGDRNEPGRESKRIRGDEREMPRSASETTWNAIEQAVVPTHHARDPFVRMASSTRASISSPNRVRPKRSAWRRMAAASNR